MFSNLKENSGAKGLTWKTSEDRAYTSPEFSPGTLRKPNRRKKDVAIFLPRLSDPRRWDQ